MARGDTQPPRRHFAEDDAGAPIDTGPKRLRYPCRADQCPMAGTVDHTPSHPGICGYHYRETPSDWPRITQALLDWECVTRAINRARRVVTDPVLCCDGKAHAEALRDEWERLLPAVKGSGWHRRVEPQKGEHIGDWGRRLEVFMGARIKSALTGREVDETKPTPFVEQARKELRGYTGGNAGDFL